MKYLTRFFVGVCIALIVGCILELAASADTSRGKENWFIQTDELSVTYKKYQPYSRSPLYYNSRLKDGVELKMNNDLGFGLIFWDNLVHASTNQYQFYMVGWQFLVGIHVTSFFDLQWDHHSQHLMDNKFPYMDYPLEDSLGFTLHIIGGGQRGISLF